MESIKSGSLKLYWLKTEKCKIMPIPCPQTKEGITFLKWWPPSGQKENGDFNLKRNVVTNFKSKNEKLYYSGLQIVSKNIFNNRKNIFSMNEIWAKLIKKNQIKGYVIPSKIRHIGDKKSILEN